LRIKEIKISKNRILNLSKYTSTRIKSFTATLTSDDVFKLSWIHVFYFNTYL